MEFETIYEFTYSYSKILHIIPLLCFTIIPIVLIIKYKSIYPNYTIKKQFIITILYLFIFVSLIMTIAMIIKIPQIISYEIQLKEAIRLNKYLMVEGEVDEYDLSERNGQNFESFQIKNISFNYSDNEIIDGFHQTSNNMGPITENGQYFRISYLCKEGRNMILKIEKKVDLLKK